VGHDRMVGGGHTLGDHLEFAEPAFEG